MHASSCNQCSHNFTNTYEINGLIPTLKVRHDNKMFLYKKGATALVENTSTLICLNEKSTQNIMMGEVFISVIFLTCKYACMKTNCTQKLFV